jgi:hypothetical protein
MPLSQTYRHFSVFIFSIGLTLTGLGSEVINIAGAVHAQTILRMRGKEMGAQRSRETGISLPDVKGRVA